MTKPRNPWTFALEVKGLNLDKLPLDRVGTLLKQFAGLMGPESNPTFAGVVKGSVVLRALDHSEHPFITRGRIQAAREQRTKPFVAIEQEIKKLSAWGRVVDRSNRSVIEFPRPISLLDREPEHVVRESGEIDGVVVGVEGKDETIHVRVFDRATGLTTSAKTTSRLLARRAGSMIQGDVIRLRVSGSWKRTVDGWIGYDLNIIDLVELDQSDVVQQMSSLRSGGDEGWSGLSAKDAEATLHKLRYGN